MVGWQEGYRWPYVSPNAPSQADVLGTWMLSMLSGHRRYPHVASIRCDGVNPGLLGMNKVISVPCAGRRLRPLKPKASPGWSGTSTTSVAPLLDAPWILDIDTTVKPLYGKQEGAVVSYNPKKPGRPAHSYHTYLMAGLRLVVGAEGKAGDAHSGSHSLPGLLKILDALSPPRRPKRVRGDCGHPHGPAEGAATAISRQAQALEEPQAPHRAHFLGRRLDRLSFCFSLGQTY